MTDTPDKQPALEATDYRYGDWYEGRLIAYGYEPSRNRRRNVSSRTVETPLTDLNRANEIIAGLEAENAALTEKVERLEEALKIADDAISEMFRYYDGGEMRGSYDGKPERNQLRKAGYVTRAALKEPRP